MKKIPLLLAIAILSSLLMSCTKKGEIHSAPQDALTIHGEVFKTVKMVPCDGCESIWIVYPKDPQSKATVINTQHDVDEDNTVSTAIINLN